MNSKIRVIKKPNKLEKTGFDTSTVFSNNISNDIEIARNIDLEVRRNALALAASIAKKYSINICECCGKKIS